MKKVLAIAALCLAAFTARGADLQRLLLDTQRTVQDPSSIIMVWWIPTEYWGAVLKDNPGITPEVLKQFETTLGSYMLFAVAALDIGPMGGMTSRGRPKIEANSQLLMDGKPVPLLTDKEIGADAQNFVSMMKPMMANMLGQFGQGMEFMLYPNPATKGGAKISAVNEGQFAYKSFGNEFKWRLPIGSLLPPRKDPATGEEFPGDFKFNPYTGGKLDGK